MGEAEVFGVRKSKVLTCKPGSEVNFYDDILAGYNHFFIDESVMADGGENVWSVPSGIFVGQTLSIRKICDFLNEVKVCIRNQDLSTPNVRGDTFLIKTNISFMSWCW